MSGNRKKHVHRWIPSDYNNHLVRASPLENTSKHVYTNWPQHLQQTEAESVVFFFAFNKQLTSR